MSEAGFHGRAGFGTRPALLVIDVNVGFTDPRRRSSASWTASSTRSDCCSTPRAAPRFPVVYTTVSYTEADKRTAAAFIDKVPALLTLEAGSRWVEIDPRIAPLPDEPVLNKLFASAFYGTTLASFLAANRLRQPDRHRSLDLGLRAGDRRRRAPARLPPDRPARGGRRPQPGRARGEPLRHRRKVRRRRLRRRGRRAPGGARRDTECGRDDRS